MKNIHINMNKKFIRLTESDLHRIVRESVNNVLNEFSIRYRDEEEKLEKEYMKYLSNIEEKFGQSISVLAQTQPNLHIMNWREFVKKNGSSELFYDLFGGH